MPAVWVLPEWHSTLTLTGLLASHRHAEKSLVNVLPMMQPSTRNATLFSFDNPGQNVCFIDLQALKHLYELAAEHWHRRTEGKKARAEGGMAERQK